jgi:hypothetical protein
MSVNLRDLARLVLRNVTNLQNDLKAFINCLEEEEVVPAPSARDRALPNSSQASSSSSSSVAPNEKAKEVAKRPLAEDDKKPAKKAKVAKDDQASKKAKDPKRVKDPNEPKRPLTAFLFFNQDHREAVVKANPAAKNTDLMGLLATKWKAAPAPVKEKYNKKAEEAKAQYTVVKKAYEEEKADAASVRVTFSDTHAHPAAKESDLFHSAFDETFDESAWGDEDSSQKKKKKKEKKHKKDRELMIFEDDE